MGTVFWHETKIIFSLIGRKGKIGACIYYCKSAEFWIVFFYRPHEDSNAFRYSPYRVGQSFWKPKIFGEDLIPGTRNNLVKEFESKGVRFIGINA